MSVITRRLSIPELSQQILEMAKVGVYRESVFEALRPMATKKQIGLAIAHAKRFGLHSVANLRDADLGTYYQLDLVKYQSLQHAIAAPANLGEDGDLVRRVVDATTAVRLMLGVAKSLSVILGLVGVLCLISDRNQVGVGLLSGALSAAGIWIMQKAFVKDVY